MATSLYHHLLRTPLDEPWVWLAYTIIFYALLLMNRGFGRLVKINLVFFKDTAFISSMSYLINAGPTELSHAKNADGQTDG